MRLACGLAVVVVYTAGENGGVGSIGVVVTGRAVVMGLWRATVSVSSRTHIRLLIVSSTFLTLRIMGWEDPSFKVALRFSRELSVM
jgi:hypothetical protein